MRVAVPSRVRKKTALRVRRSVAVGYVGVGWGGGGVEWEWWDGVQSNTKIRGSSRELIRSVGHRKDSQAGVASVSHHQPSYPSRLLLVLSQGSLL